MSARPEDDTSKQMRRALYEIGALWQRVRKAERSQAARAYLGSAQSIASSSWTKVAVDSTSDDPSGLFDSASNQIEASKAGWWLVSVGVGFDGSTGGDRRFAAIAHNGSRVARSTGPTLGGNVGTVAVTDVVKASAGDTFVAHAWQDSGGSLGLRAQEPETWLSAAFLGAA